MNENNCAALIVSTWLAVDNRTYGSLIDIFINDPRPAFHLLTDQFSSDRDEIFCILRAAPPDFQKGTVLQVQMPNSAFTPRIPACTLELKSGGDRD